MRRVRAACACAVAFAILAGAPVHGATRGDARVTVGSKAFTEGVLLGEIATQTLNRAALHTVHRAQLGGTRILWKALLAGDIDVYAEYTGTLREEIFAAEHPRTRAEVERLLAGAGVVMTAPLGFDDTYAIGMPDSLAARLGIRTISDLARHPSVRFGFSHEFLDRADGWPGLRATYGLSAAHVRGVDHALAYRGLRSGSLDATDLYSTDAEIRQYHLRVLIDDRHYFPEYQAVFLMRRNCAEQVPEALAHLEALAGHIDVAAMRAMNAEVTLDHAPESQVAARFLDSIRRAGAAARPDGAGVPADESVRQRLMRQTGEHLALVGGSLLAALLVALPLGVLCARRKRLGDVVLGLTGIAQTIPSLALLVMLIPLLGIGAPPAVAALFLYSLLPIVRNTATGLGTIAPSLRESADTLGFTPWQRLSRVELPLASPTILAGIQTAAVINVGTATIGALIGAGGYGQSILTGIRLDDRALILQGAVPAALLALAVQFAFDGVGRLVVPRGLRLPARTGRTR